MNDLQSTAFGSAAPSPLPISIFPVPVGSCSTFLSGGTPPELFEFFAERLVEAGLVGRIERNQFFPGFLIEVLLKIHARFVARRIESPVFDIDIELGEIKVGADLKPLQNAQASIIAIVDPGMRQPVGNLFFRRPTVPECRRPSGCFFCPPRRFPSCVV